MAKALSHLRDPWALKYKLNPSSAFSQKTIQLCKSTGDMHTDMAQNV